MTDLIRSPDSIAWELRAAWATGRRVALTIAADVPRVEGHVSTVSATGASVTVAGLMIPLASVLAVHLPSRLGDSTITATEAWRGRRPGAAQRDPRQLTLPLDGA